MRPDIGHHTNCKTTHPATSKCVQILNGPRKSMFNLLNGLYVPRCDPSTGGTKDAIVYTLNRNLINRSIQFLENKIITALVFNLHKCKKYI